MFVQVSILYTQSGKFFMKRARSDDEESLPGLEPLVQHKQSDV